MAFSEAQIRANMEHFAHKLRTEKSRATVLHAVEDNKFDFVLLDTRGRQAFASGHIPGALCAPMEEFGHLTAHLPKEKEIVTYCWGHD